MSSDSVSIPDRPIEAGVYSWGWVSYGGYDDDAKPTELSVTMFDEPTTEKAMGSLRRLAERSYWLSMLICYGPMTFGALAVTLGNVREYSWLSQLALGTMVISGWLILKRLRGTKELSKCTVLSANRNLENYLAGKDFLRALSNPALSRGDLFAYFDLRARSSELHKALSDDVY